MAARRKSSSAFYREQHKIARNRSDGTVPHTKPQRDPWWSVRQTRPEVEAAQQRIMDAIVREVLGHEYDPDEETSND